MQFSAWKSRLMGLSLAASLALPALARGQEFDAQVAPPAKPFGVALDEFKPSSHWIGVVVRPIDEVTRTHLKLEGGLVVDEVSPDSPAATAGIEQYDILLALNDDAVIDLKGLMNFLSENKEKVIVVKLLRAGEAKTVEVAPAERPADQFKFFPPDEFNFELPEGKLPEEIQRWMKEFAQDPQKLRAWRFEGEPLRARFFHPGVLLGDKEAEARLETGKLPDNLQVSIIKEGDKPAQIKVRRGDESWEVSETELDKLPDDVRGHVKQYLAPAADPLGIRVEPPRGDAAWPRVKVFAAPHATPPIRVETRAVRVAGPDLEKQLDEINTRLEKIERALEKLAQ